MNDIEPGSKVFHGSIIFIYELAYFSPVHQLGEMINSRPTG
jgi:hypothetical protein